jgi:superkiller protein 3
MIRIILKFFKLGTFIYFFFCGTICTAQENPLLGPDINVMFTQASTSEHGGNFPAAINIYKKILQTRPENVCAINSIAGLYGKLNQYDDEILWAKKAMKIDAAYSLAYINYGDALLNQGKLAEAKQAYQKVIELNPKSAMAYYNLGFLADKENDLASAISWYQKAVDLDPALEDAYFNLGVDYAALHRYLEASAAFKKVLELNPKAEDAKKMLLELKKN